MEMMSLKNAFTYINVLSDAINKTLRILSTSDYVLSIKRTHKKSQALKDAEDVVEEVVVPTEYECTANQALALLDALVVEKNECMAAISVAKQKSDVDIDCLISVNKQASQIRATLTRLAERKTTVSEEQGTAYVFNNEGNQVMYRYPVETVRTIEYDRNAVKKEIKRLSEQIVAKSEIVDRAMLEPCVAFTPRWSEVDTFEDILESIK